MKFLFSVFLLICHALCSYSQNIDTSGTILPEIFSQKIKFSAFADIYYAYDLANPSSHERPSFIYNHNRHNEINLNLGLIKAAYTSNKIRAALALMAGTYAQYNLASEPALLQHVYEANAGIKLKNDRNLWIDAGIFTSHIGFESAISKDCWTLTRSIVAENSPYYLSGLKITYTTISEKLLLSALYLNGWQKIQRQIGNNSPNFGTQVTYTPNTKLIVNYSTFIGSDKPDSNRLWRVYHNFYFIYQPFSKLGITAGFDYGTEQKYKNTSDLNVWYSPTVILKYSLSQKFDIAARIEYFDDPTGVIISTQTPSGFKTSGYSLNFDYKPETNFIVRIEGRVLNSRDKMFTTGTINSNQNYFMVLSFAVSI